MRMVPDEVRRARMRRGPLLVLASLAIAVALLARAWPASRPWCPTGEIGTCLVLGLAWGLAAAATWRARRHPAWSSLDGVAWVELVGALSLVSVSSHAPVGAAILLESIALVLFALRDPADALVGLAATLALVGPVARLLLARDVSGALGALVATTGGLAGFAATLVQTRRFVRARDASVMSLPTEPARPVRAPSTRVGNAPPAPARERASSPRTATERRADLAADTSWDAIVQRVRESVTSLAESAGVAFDVRIELAGLAPPSAKIRTHLPRIAQEATSHTLRHGDARSITATLRRGDGGVVFELRDDGTTESSRQRRTLTALRGRVAALGGTAEVSRGDLGWVTSVRLPCDQLN